MRRIVGFLFPYRQIFRRLGLEARWWHRLVIVLFVPVLISTFLLLLVYGLAETQPLTSFAGGIQEWVIVPAPSTGVTVGQDPTPIAPPPDANSISQGKVAIAIKDIFDVAGTNVTDSDLRKTIVMPNGTTVTYPGTVSNDVIWGDWQKRFSEAQFKASLLGFGIAALGTLMFSYLLQVIYRSALYVAFGAKTNVDAAIHHAGSDAAKELKQS